MQNRDTEPDNEQAMRQRLAHFDATHVPFPETWQITNSSDRAIENINKWTEFHPSSWQDLADSILAHQDNRQSSLRSLRNLIFELEQILKINPSLWTAFVKDGGRCCLYTGDAKDGGGTCYDYQQIFYRGQSYHPRNVLAHEIGHTIDNLESGLYRSREQWRQMLFMTSPLFQEAVSLDLYHANDFPYMSDDPPVSARFSHMIRQGGLEGQMNNMSDAVAHTREVREGKRLPGDDSFYRTNEQKTKIFKREKRSELPWLRNHSTKKLRAMDATSQDSQLRLPTLNPRQMLLSEKATKLAEKWMKARNMDVRSTWLEAFACVMEIYYGMPGLDIKSLPYPALNHFMERCVAPTLELLASDELAENQGAQIARIGRLINEPLEKMMPPKDYKRYVKLRKTIDDYSSPDNKAKCEAQRILIRTIDRVVDAIEESKGTTPSQRPLF